MNVNIFSKETYEKKCDWTFGENKPNSKPNKANLLAVSKMPKMNITSATTANYINELRTTNYELIMENKANSKPIQTRSGAQIPTGVLLGIPERGTQLQTQRLSKLFLAFTFLCPSYNLAMQTWTIQRQPQVLTKPTFDETLADPTATEKYEASLKRLADYREIQGQDVLAWWPRLSWPTKRARL